MLYSWYPPNKPSQLNVMLTLFFASFLLLTIVSPALGDETKKGKYSRPFLIKKLEFQEINTWYALYLRENLRVAKEKKSRPHHS